jgi:NADPH:quinone reductase-like Zn-dependent oxidoreductase
MTYFVRSLADSVAGVAMENDSERRAMQTTRPTTSMPAIVQEAYGPADVLRPATLDVPDIADDEVLVQVRAAGLDRGTWHLMTGRPYLIRIMGFGLRAPKNRVPGLDLAGTVVAVGSAVTRFAPGDEVFGIGKGSFAGFAAASESKLARMPAGLSFEQAAVVPVSGLAAIQGLRDAGRLRPGQRVLIVGASGGVGSYAVQIAKALGAAEVTGVCSAAKVDLVRDLGADHVIDYTREDFSASGRRYDLILDIGGGTKVSRLRRALTSQGTLVIVGGEQGGRWTGGIGRQLRAIALSPFVRQRLTMMISKENHADLEALSELIEAGAVVPSIGETEPLERVPEAMRRLEAGGVRGKTAILI